MSPEYQNPNFNRAIGSREPNDVGQQANPLDVQMGGVHYKNKAIQPVEYIAANNLNFLEGCIVKRITRWRDKPGQDRFADLRKIQHEIDLLIAMETRFNPEPTSVGSKLDVAEYRRPAAPSPSEWREADNRGRNT